MFHLRKIIMFIDIGEHKKTEIESIIKSNLMDFERIRATFERV